MPKDERSELVERLTRPIISIENRTALEAFDIMCDRITRGLASLDPQAAPSEPCKYCGIRGGHCVDCVRPRAASQAGVVEALREARQDLYLLRSAMLRPDGDIGNRIERIIARCDSALSQQGLDGAA